MGLELMDRAPHKFQLPTSKNFDTAGAFKSVLIIVLFSSYSLISPKLTTLPCLQTGVRAAFMLAHFVLPC